MKKHMIELSADSYKKLEELKQMLIALSGDEGDVTNEDVIDFAVREITESIKMMQEHHHDHEGHECCGGHGKGCC